MMDSSILKEVQDLIIKGRLDKALSLLIEFCENTGSDNYHEVILLSTQFHIIERKERVGLGEFNQEINRIAHAILGIVLEEKSKNSIPMKDNRSFNDAEQPIERIEAKIDRLMELLKTQIGDSIKSLEKEYFWRHLEPSSKNYLYSAEKTFVLDDLFDYSSVVIQYAKTLESEFINKIFNPYKNLIQTANPKDVENHNSKIIELFLGFKERKLSFSDVVKYVVAGLREESEIELSFATFIENTMFIINKSELIMDLEGVVELRNRAAHVGIITRIEAEQFRNKIFSILRNILNRPFQVNKKSAQSMG